jgi:hypothetical protein
MSKEKLREQELERRVTLTSKLHQIMRNPLSAHDNVRAAVFAEALLYLISRTKP